MFLPTPPFPSPPEPDSYPFPSLPAIPSVLQVSLLCTDTWPCLLSERRGQLGPVRPCISHHPRTGSRGWNLIPLGGSRQKPQGLGRETQPFFTNREPLYSEQRLGWLRSQVAFISSGSGHRVHDPPPQQDGNSEEPWGPWGDICLPSLYHIFP